MSEFYSCPRCKGREGLWRGIELSGWEALNDDLTTTGEREALWPGTSDGTYGCTCGWEGRKDGLTLNVLGIDGKPLPEVHPAQLAIGGSDG